MCVICRGEYKNLKHIACYRCPDLEVFPKIVGVQDVQIRECSRLRRIEDNPTLETLAVGDLHSLERLPGAPGLPKLRELYCMNTPLIEAIPKYTGLRVLECSIMGSQKLTSLPHIDGLNRLYCDNTFVTVIPNIRGLKWLTCSKSSVNTVPAIAGLEYLDVSWSDVRTIPAIDSLTELRCDRCEYLHTIPHMKSLEDLSCCSCPWLVEVPLIATLKTVKYNSKNVAIYVPRRLIRRRITGVLPRRGVGLRLRRILYLQRLRVALRAARAFHEAFVPGVQGIIAGYL